MMIDAWLNVFRANFMEGRREPFVELNPAMCLYREARFCWQKFLPFSRIFFIKADKNSGNALGIKTLRLRNYTERGKRARAYVREMLNVRLILHLHLTIERPRHDDVTSFVSGPAR